MGSVAKCGSSVAKRGSSVAKSGFILGMILLVGCMADSNVKELQDTNAQLERELMAASDEISDLRVQEERLRSNISELERLIGILETEKSSRVQESSQLRQLVRGFIRDQIDDYRSFLLRGDLLDYVGSELVQRAHQSEEEALFLLDLSNPMPRSGTLTGFAGYFYQQGQVSLRVLRPLDDELVVIWTGPEMTVSEPGRVRMSLPVSVGVEAGDIVGYHFSGPVAVSHDRGTGEVVRLREDLALGAVIKRKNLPNQSESRAYSIGALGLLN